MSMIRGEKECEFGFERVERVGKKMTIKNKGRSIGGCVLWVMAIHVRRRS